MHGKLKVRTTAEQQEAKRKEREKKQKLYTAATTMAFEKRTNEEFDVEALTLTGEILAVNPDFYSLWNYRKEILIDLKEKRSSEDLNKLFQDELYFLESCLKVNPKSYGTWHHRCFVLNNMPTPDWSRELELCNKFLEYDERNFHCWDYRRFVVKTSEVSATDEFDFTTAKIESNFSNYSSWHYRSKLLPILHPDQNHPSGVNENILLKEFETVQNAFFTDPNDQSSWFYHRWLLGRGSKNLSIDTIFVSRTARCIIVTVTKPIMINKLNGITLFLNSIEVKADWLNQRQQLKYSTLWKITNIDIPDGEIDITVSLDNGLTKQTIYLKSEQDVNWYTAYFKQRNRFSHELSSATSDILKRELEAIQELYEIESDNKWVILTTMSLMKSLDPLQYEEDILKHVVKLQELDPKRRIYYQDLRSKVLVENVLEILDSDQRHLDLSKKELSVLYHTELLPLITKLDLHSNMLTSVNAFEFLQCVKQLVLDDNQICDISGINCLHQLEFLSLKNNLIENTDQITVLQTCSRLCHLDIQDNPVCNDDINIDKIQQILPYVSINSP